MSIDVDNNAILQTVFSLAGTCNNFPGHYHPINPCDETPLFRVVINLAYKLKDGIHSPIDEEFHNLIQQLPDHAFDQEVHGHPAMIYICGHYSHEVFTHFFIRREERVSSVEKCSMLIYDENYNGSDILYKPRYLFNVACDRLGVDYVSSICNGWISDAFLVSIVLEETMIPSNYSLTHKYLLSSKIQRLIQKKSSRTGCPF